MRMAILKLKLPVWLKTVLKLLVLIIIITLIVRKIDERLLLNVLAEAHPLWIIWAFFWFILSKFIASLRFNALLHTEQIHMTSWQNAKLYWLCMYYNLLLPGGISGDGYKIKVLMDRFHRSFKRLLTITLIDRASGAVALGQLGLVLLYFIPNMRIYWIWTLPAFVLSLTAIGFLYKGFKVYKVVWLNTIQSLGVQGAQAIATLGLVFALGQQSKWPDYLILFLISSLVAMIPMTIGGAGAREITFLYGSRLLAIDAEKAVAIAFLFYLISTSVSFFGIMMSVRKNIVFKGNKI